MSKFTRALNTLKRKLVRIKGAELTYSEVELENLADSNQLFADPTLLPIDISHSELSNFTLPSNSPYSERTLQAVWNIADISNSIATSLSPSLSKNYNNSALVRNFNYLSASWTPKLIDDKTYQMGLALLEFLQVATPDKEAIAILPQTALRKMQTQLKIRLDVFNAHRPEKRAQLLELIPLNTEISEFQEEYKDVEWDILALQGMEPFRTKLSSDPVQIEPIAKLIQEREDLIQEFESSIEECEQKLRSWLEKNQDFFPDGQVTKSAFYDLPVADSKQQKDLIGLWMVLYNNVTTPDFVVTTNPYQEGLDWLAKAKLKMQETKTQVLQLKERKDTIHALQKYEQELTQVQLEIADLALPPYLTLEEEGLQYQITLSIEENKKTRLETDKISFSLLAQNLHTHGRTLAIQQQKLQQQHDEFAHPNPSTRAAESEDFMHLPKLEKRQWSNYWDALKPQEGNATIFKSSFKMLRPSKLKMSKTS